jgi:hypothetical protein
MKITNEQFELNHLRRQIEEQKKTLDSMRKMSERDSAFISVIIILNAITTLNCFI